LGEEEPGPEDAERGGYLPIPRRDARAGEWVTGDASAELNRPQRPERPVGSEPLSVEDTANSDEQSGTVCEEREENKRCDMSKASEHGRQHIRDHLKENKAMM
jgi:hypothetical protein